MGAVIRFMDKLQSFVQSLSVIAPANSGIAGAIPVVYSDAELLEAYRVSWLARKIVDVPALDSCRKWRDWQADKEQIEAIEAEENRLDVRGKVLEARTKARLFGGAAILIGDGAADLSQPFDPARMGREGLFYLTVLLRRHLSHEQVETDPASEWYGKPRAYRLQSKKGKEEIIHPSRLVIFRGASRGDDELVGQDGWGDSVLVAVLRAIGNAEDTASNVAALVSEAKIDIVRVPNLMASLAQPEYESRLLQRFRLANVAKGLNSVLLLDKDEEWDQKTASFATLPEVLRSFMELAAGAADIPLTRLLGTSPGGLNATGESDIRNYYDRIAASQAIDMTPAMHRLDEALIRSALGSRPKEVFYTWSSLWQISDKERSEIGEKIASVIEKLNSSALYPPEALAKAGANALVEHSVLPGFDGEIEDAGGLPDYEMQAEQEAEQERLRLEAAAGKVPRKTNMGGAPVGDATFR
jgi:phage-related protein (TIGR01555 family)